MRGRDCLLRGFPRQCRVALPGDFLGGGWPAVDERVLARVAFVALLGILGVSSGARS